MAATETTTAPVEQKPKIYVARPTGHHILNKDAKPRLIKAKTPLAALKFATRAFYTTELATAEVAAELGAEGTKIEDATAEAE